MTDGLGGLVIFGIDESKVTIYTRGQRLRDRIVGWLGEVKQQAEAGKAALQPEDPPVFDNTLAELDEALAWLNEMKV